jgi:hypothetical protein
MRHNKQDKKQNLCGNSRNYHMSQHAKRTKKKPVQWQNDYHLTTTDRSIVLTPATPKPES